MITAVSDSVNYYGISAVCVFDYANCAYRTFVNPLNKSTPFHIKLYHTQRGRQGRAKPMQQAHIIPGVNGWTHDAPKILRAIERREREKLHAVRAEENAAARECAELEYYEENHCFPRPTGYFGTETDAHFYER